MVALLLPAVQAARESARRSQCTNNLRQLALACHNFEGARGGYPPVYLSGSQPGWITAVLPYIEEASLSNLWPSGLDPTNTQWKDPSLTSVVSTPIAVALCPTNPEMEKVLGPPTFSFTAATADYAAAVSFNTDLYPRLYTNGATDVTSPMQVGKLGRIAGVTDGTSKTILIVEMSGRPFMYLVGHQKSTSTTNNPRTYGFGFWAHNNAHNISTFLADGSDRGIECAVNCSNQFGVYGFHAAGAHVAFADGSARLLADTISPAVLAALVTRAGHEILGDEY